MKSLKQAFAALVTAALLATPLAGFADDAKKSDKSKPYPLKTCIVTGEKLGEMGDPYVHTYQNREIKFCCKSCLKKFDKDAAGYLKKIDEAEQKAKK
jgi:hypothetical protein